MPERLAKSRRIVIKAGTSILTTAEGNFSHAHLARLGGEILRFIKMGKQVVLVSSGAIALGMEVQKFKKRPKEMSRLQACAAVGQGKLMHAYESFFSKRGVHAAQVLLTRDALENRDRFVNASQTLEELLNFGVIPIINENDTVATEEIAFGDNDILSVYVANLVQADLLIILSDVDGFYLRDGSRVRRVSSKKEIEEELSKHITDQKKERTVGGMRAKLKAASQAMRLGIPLLMVSGHEPEVMFKAVAGDDVGTLFLPSDQRRSSRDMWIAFAAPRQGMIVVDAGAYEALRIRKCSLLPKGILKIRGNFVKGQIVELQTPEGKVFGRGIAKYGSRELAQVAGKRTDEIVRELGQPGHEEAVHRNDMVLWD